MGLVDSQKFRDDFHDLVARLTAQYDRQHARCAELEAENAGLRNGALRRNDGATEVALAMARPSECSQRYSMMSDDPFETLTLEATGHGHGINAEDFRGREI